MHRILVTARVVVGLAATALAACQGTSAEPSAAALANAPFFITGTITEVGQPGGYRIRGEPGTSYRVNEAYFRVDAETELRRADGTALPLHPFGNQPAKCFDAAAAMPTAAGAPGACSISSSRLITDSRTAASYGTSPSSSIITGLSRLVLT